MTRWDFRDLLGEVVEQGRGRPRAQEVAEANWITVRGVTALEIIQLLQTELDEGKKKAIALAHEVGVLDERDARRVAKQLNLRVLGTIGALIWARKTGEITSLRSALEALQTQARFRISQQLYERALDEVGEL